MSEGNIAYLLHTVDNSNKIDRVISGKVKWVEVRLTVTGCTRPAYPPQPFCTRPMHFKPNRETNPTRVRLILFDCIRRVRWTGTTRHGEPYFNRT